MAIAGSHGPSIADVIVAAGSCNVCVAEGPLIVGEMVEQKGIEPSTSALRTRRSPS
jgi:hypothetical protein